MFQALAPYLPATVIAAIFLFAIKEALEFRKKHKENQRKIQAIKHFIARDLELCQWAIHTYRNVLAAFKIAEEEPGTQLRIYTEPSGRLRYERWEEGKENEIRSGGMVAPVVNAFASRFMLEIATLDKSLYEQVEKTTDDLAELEHIKAGLMDNIDDHIHRGGFIHYAELEINEIERSIQNLYKVCTGLDEVKRRIR